MELIQSPFFLFFSSLVLAIFIFIGRFKSTTNPNSRLPPGPRKLPFIGNIHNLAGALPHRALHKLALKYGPMMHLQLGELSTVIVSSPELAKEVLKTHDASLASRPKMILVEIMANGCTAITFAPYGEPWRQMKKFLSQELLNPNQVQSLRSTREQVFFNIVAHNFASNEGSPVNFSEIVYSAVSRIVSMAAFGNVTKDSEKLMGITRKTLELASGFDIADLYPSVKMLWRLSAAKQLLKFREDTDVLFENIIRDHRETNRDKGERVDVMDALLKHKDEASGLPLTIDSIKAVIMDILAAGIDTSSTTSDWAMAEMMKNPTILEKVQAEVRDVFYHKGSVDEAEFNQLKYLKAVIKETLRLHAPVPLLLPRKCMPTCEINGYEIPTDTKVILNVWAINRDPLYWDNPESFQPERFLDSAIDYKGNNFKYIPFGGGRRLCPGITFGLANVELSLAVSLYHFDWKLPDGMKPEGMVWLRRSESRLQGRNLYLLFPFLKELCLERESKDLMEQRLKFLNQTPLVMNRYDVIFPLFSNKGHIRVFLPHKVYKEIYIILQENMEL